MIRPMSGLTSTLARKRGILEARTSGIENCSLASLASLP
jgi:hypothetical protein